MATLSGGQTASRGGLLLACAGMWAGIALILLAIVDARRALLFENLTGLWAYWLRTPYAAFSLGQAALWLLGLALASTSFLVLRKREPSAPIEEKRRAAAATGVVLLILLVVDLFAYRGVAAGRTITTGNLSAAWLDGLGWSGGWKPVGVALAYGLTVWHATFLGLLLSGLAMVYLPSRLEPFASRSGLSGSLWGTAFAVPQPFCSCCAAAWAPTLVRRGASSEFLLSFVVASPMVNVTTLILAATLLPFRYALLRIVSGIALPALLAYGVVRLAGGRPRPIRCISEPTTTSGSPTFDGNAPSSPSQLVVRWLASSAKLALWFVPVMLAVSAAAAWLFEMLPGGCVNNLGSVLVASIGGTLLMVSTWSEIPLAHQLIASGCYAPAATLLVVLPPVSLPCLAILSTCTGQWRQAVLLGIAVMIVGVLVGVCFL